MGVDNVRIGREYAIRAIATRGRCTDHHSSASRRRCGGTVSATGARVGTGNYHNLDTNSLSQLVTYTDGIGDTYPDRDANSDADRASPNRHCGRPNACTHHPNPEADCSAWLNTDTPPASCTDGASTAQWALHPAT